MQRYFLLLTFCALAVAVPRYDMPVEINAQELGTRTQSKVIQVANSAEFSAKLSTVGDELVVVFSMANWCPFSIGIIPTVEDIAANNEGVVVFQVDIPTVVTTPGIPWEHGVTSVNAVPTFFFIRSGIVLERYTSGDSALLRNTVARYLASGRDYTLLH